VNGIIIVIIIIGRSATYRHETTRGRIRAAVDA